MRIFNKINDDIAWKLFEVQILVDSDKYSKIAKKMKGYIYHMFCKLIFILN